jgi:hypothetical protein
MCAGILQGNTTETERIAGADVDCLGKRILEMSTDGSYRSSYLKQERKQQNASITIFFVEIFAGTTAIFRACKGYVCNGVQFLRFLITGCM